jgi:asparagine synthase (glutamine-hydrolysing)
MYLRLPAFLRRSLLEPIGTRLPTSFKNFSPDFKIKKFISGVESRPEVRHQIWMGAFTPSEKEGLFLPSIKDTLRAASDLNPLFNNLKELSSREAANSQTKILFSDMRLYLQDDILTKADRASMANSLEVRSPFLDNELVDYVNGLNFSLKLKRLQSKFILKKMLLAKRILPAKIINRPKKGFGIPVAKWINKEMKEMVLDLLSEQSIKDGGLFNYAYVKRILKEHFDFKKDNRKGIWALLMFELWKKKYLK